MSILDKLRSNQNESKKPISVEEIREMSARGLSDKDIIKTYKSRGYNYDEIEGAMLQAVKEGVGSDYSKQSQQESMENMYPQQEEFMPPVLDQQNSQVLPEEEVNPEVIVEELVEGVVEEKWKKFAQGIERTQKELDLMKTNLKQMHNKMDQMKQPKDTSEIEAQLNEISERLEEFEARVGGLEKAFRQFLPSLTKNIENLSNIIHEMNKKQM
jgi:prefoldin subunit 5